MASRHAQRRIGTGLRLDSHKSRVKKKLAGRTVPYEPVSATWAPLTGKSTGIFVFFVAPRVFTSEIAVIPSLPEKTRRQRTAISVFRCTDSAGICREITRTYGDCRRTACRSIIDIAENH
jgi:hypothetical protein